MSTLAQGNLHASVIPARAAQLFALCPEPVFHSAFDLPGRHPHRKRPVLLEVVMFAADKAKQASSRSSFGLILRAGIATLCLSTALTDTGWARGLGLSVGGVGGTVGGIGGSIGGVGGGLTGS